MNKAKAVKHLKTILDGDSISDNKQEITAFAAQGAVYEKGVAPSLLVRPKDEQELQKIIQAANEQGWNLTVASSTGSHQRGGVAGVEKNMGVDLSGWDQVLWVNRRNRVAQVQAGVTYGQLLDALAAHEMTTAMPLAPRNGKSVVAAVLDREPTTWPNTQWDISDPVCSTEYFFGTGDKFRTGAAGGPGSLEEQRASGGAQKCSLGPSQGDFHRVVSGGQGTMGLVTWITVRCEILPTMEKPYLVGAGRLERLLPYVYEVQRPWLGEHSFILNRTALALLVSGCMARDYEEVRGGLPPWACLQNIAGFERLPADRVAYQEADILSIADRFGLELEPRLGSIWARDLLYCATHPSGEADWRSSLMDDCLSVFFQTTLDKTPDFHNQFMALAEKHGVARNKVGVYIQPMVQNHFVHMEFLVPFNPRSNKQRQQARDLEAQAVPALAETGAFFSRPYGTAGKIAFRQNPLGYDVLKKIKGIFDPNRVLQRGKWGL